MKMTRIAGVALLVGCALVGETQAQYRPPQRPVGGGFGGYSRPAYSPYLNLLRGGNAAINYYGLVRPEREFRQALTQVQSQLGTGGSGTDASGEDMGPTTGHGVYFDNLSHYYGGLQAGGAPGQGGLSQRFGGGFSSGAARGGFGASRFGGGAGAGAAAGARGGATTGGRR